MQNNAEGDDCFGTMYSYTFHGFDLGSGEGLDFIKVKKEKETLLCVGEVLKGSVHNWPFYFVQFPSLVTSNKGRKT